MDKAIESPVSRNGGHLVEPPILDSLHRDDDANGWVLSFIPEETVSSREKEIVIVPFSSNEGRRITLRMDRLAKLLGHSINRVFHGGDGRFTFYTERNEPVAMPEPSDRLDLSVRAYGELTDIAMTAQLLFVSSQVRTAAG